MKKILIILVLISLPTTTFAAWWNPLTWFGNNKVPEQSPILLEEQIYKAEKEEKPATSLGRIGVKEIYEEVHSLYSQGKVEEALDILDNLSNENHDKYVQYSNQRRQQLDDEIASYKKQIEEYSKDVELANLRRQEELRQLKQYKDKQDKNYEMLLKDMNNELKRRYEEIDRAYTSNVQPPAKIHSIYKTEPIPDPTNGRTYNRGYIQCGSGNGVSICEYR